MIQQRNIAVCIILSIVTCGIYGIYWCYKMGQQLDTAYQNRGVPAPGKGTILLILAIFGLSIISYALIQDDLNKISAMDGGVQA